MVADQLEELEEMKAACEPDSRRASGLELIIKKGRWHTRTSRPTHTTSPWLRDSRIVRP
jgi:hypothetical protein